jgi:hypothetical protein
MPIAPEDVRSWYELGGAFLAGLFGLRGAQALHSRGSAGEGEREEIVAAIRIEGAETRKVLTAMRTDLSILLDRDDHRWHGDAARRGPAP